MPAILRFAHPYLAGADDRTAASRAALGAQWDGKAGPDQARTRCPGAGAGLLRRHAGGDRSGAGHHARGRAAETVLPAAAQPAAVADAVSRRAVPVRPATRGSSANGPARAPGHRPGPGWPG